MHGRQLGNLDQHTAAQSITPWATSCTQHAEGFAIFFREHDTTALVLGLSQQHLAPVYTRNMWFSCNRRILLQSKRLPHSLCMYYCLLINGAPAAYPGRFLFSECSALRLPL